MDHYTMRRLAQLRTDEDLRRVHHRRHGAAAGAYTPAPHDTGRSGRRVGLVGLRWRRSQSSP